MTSPLPGLRYPLRVRFSAGYPPTTYPLVDLTASVRLTSGGLTIKRGRATELDAAQPGTCTFTLDNLDGRWTQARDTTGAVTPTGIPFAIPRGTPVLVESLWLDGAWHPEFTGTVVNTTHDYASRLIQVDCVDQLLDLAKTSAYSTVVTQRYVDSNGAAAFNGVVRWPLDDSQGAPLNLPSDTGTLTTLGTGGPAGVPAVQTGQRAPVGSNLASDFGSWWQASNQPQDAGGGRFPNQGAVVQLSGAGYSWPYALAFWWAGLKQSSGDLLTVIAGGVAVLQVGAGGVTIRNPANGGQSATFPLPTTFWDGRAHWVVAGVTGQGDARVFVDNVQVGFGQTVTQGSYSPVYGDGIFLFGHEATGGAGAVGRSYANGLISKVDLLAVAGWTNASVRQALTAVWTAATSSYYSVRSRSDYVLAQAAQTVDGSLVRSLLGLPKPSTKNLNLSQTGVVPYGSGGIVGGTDEIAALATATLGWYYAGRDGVITLKARPLPAQTPDMVLDAEADLHTPAGPPVSYQPEVDAGNVVVSWGPQGSGRYASGGGLARQVDTTLASAGGAQALANRIVARTSTTATYPGGLAERWKPFACQATTMSATKADAVMALDIGSAVRLSNLSPTQALNPVQDLQVEGITKTWSDEGVLVVLDTTPNLASDQPGFWRLNLSKLNRSTILGYQ